MRRRPRADSPPAGSPYAAGLRLLSRRDLSRAELTARLLARGYPEDDVEAALHRLAETGAIDDRRTAAAYVRTASRVKGRGRLRIRRELEAKGIDRSIAREALDEIPADEDRRAVERFVARASTRAGADTPAGRRRLFQQLLRRGFDAEVIGRVLKGAE
jgi:regulatory protein